MTTEWIATLTQDLKQKNHEAGEDYNRQQHQLGIIAERAKPFFDSLVSCLETDINEIRRQLQGDVTSSETIIQTIKANDVKITRARFPWFDAHLTASDADIILDYAQGRGTAGDPNLDRKTARFSFTVAPDDSFSVQEAFSPQPLVFQKPEDLARHIIELLFQPSLS